MAFHQPTYQHHHPQRIHPDLERSPVNIQSPQPSEQLDDSQEWILFSPVAASTTDRTYTASTQRTRWTAGQSRRSEYGSLETAAQSHGYEEDASEHTETIIEEEEDGELDSLDSHLHEFRAETSAFRESSTENINVGGIPVLPTHDGLGSFRIDRTAMGEGIQEHLYAFERFNPRRIKRRRESFELGQMALENERMVEHERTRRIEEWRLGQSRALLDEIQKETRRRKQSLSSERRSMIHDGQEEEAATLGSVLDGQSEQLEYTTRLPEHENVGFWSRITRRVIQDLMGIDDNLLSILFGEALPEDMELTSTSPSNNFSSLDAMAGTGMENATWEYRLLNRIARELGLLVNQLSDHPGAFPTYLKVQQMPLPYAGLPIIPEVVQDNPRETGKSTMAASAPDFRPTLQVSTQPIEISGGLSRSAYEAERVTYDMDATPRPEAPIHRTLETQDSTPEFTKEEWEKQLDIKIVFRYLRSRFTSRPVSHPSFSRDASHLATSSPQDAAARMARVRQHHPLVTRQKPAERRTFKVTVPNSPILHRRGSSCASQSTRKSARRNSGSSRHYWDINGSIGSGSLIASAGAWGEV
jgi:hypothetical protein